MSIKFNKIPGSPIGLLKVKLLRCNSRPKELEHHAPSWSIGNIACDPLTAFLHSRLLQ
jgi:hypothetical protein